MIKSELLNRKTQIIVSLSWLDEMDPKDAPRYKWLLDEYDLVKKALADISNKGDDA